MKYLKEADLAVIKSNSLRVPAFLISNNRLSAESKLLYSIVMDNNCSVEDLKEFGYTMKTINKCLGELLCVGLINLENGTIKVSDFRSAL